MDLNERFAYLGEILVSLAGTPTPSHHLQMLADHASVVVPCDYMAVCLVDPDQEGYLVHSLYGVAVNAVPSRRFGLDEGVVGQVIRTGRGEVMDDIRTRPGTMSELESVCDDLGLEAALIAPLRQGEAVVGALFFAAQPPKTYDDDDERLAGLLAAGLSAGLETARLYQRLSDERSMLAAVFRSAQDATLVVNEQGTVLMANPAVRDMLHLVPDEITGQPLPKVVANESLRRLFAENQQTMAEIELPDERIAQASLVPVASPYGERIGWAAILRDITLLKELEQMKNDFVQTVSHDLKNPITSITLGANLLDRAGALNEDQADIRRRIINTATYMEELVTDLLDLGKIEAGVELSLRPFNLVELIQDVVGRFRPEAAKQDVAINVTVPEEIPVVGDERRLRQVLLNLVGNAVKYTPAGERITVTGTIAEGGTTTIKVSDSGIGIPASDLPYIFDKFYRVESDATKDIRGTGLGLAIGKSIVEAHDGRIWAESVEGEGSTFTFTLPLRDSER